MKNQGKNLDIFESFFGFAQPPPLALPLDPAMGAASPHCKLLWERLQLRYPVRSTDLTPGAWYVRGIKQR